MEKRYLGDGVYVDVGGYPGEFVMTTENGISVQNCIVLDLTILRDLERWIQQWRQEVHALAPKGDDGAG